MFLVDIHAKALRVERTDRRHTQKGPRDLYGDCTWVGFDLDHTLCRYHVPDLLLLIHNGLAAFLTEYLPDAPAGYFTDSVVDIGFFRRGILFDVVDGDLVQLTDSGCVDIAYHGLMRKEGRGDIKQVWQWFDVLESGASAKGKFFLFTDYFSLGACYAIALMVDLVDKKRCAKLPTYQSCLDVTFAFFDASFSWRHFEERKGSYFPEIIRNPAKYIKKREGFVQYLRGLRAGGIKVFMATNSHYSYTSFLLEFITGDKEWSQNFDVTFVYTQKPSFFLHDNEVFALSEIHEAHPTSLNPREVEMHQGKVYIGGNAKLFSGAQVAYAGDHLLSDFEAAMNIGWRGIAVIEDDDLCNVELGTHFGPRLMEMGGSYWGRRVTMKSASIVSDVLR